VSAASGAKLAAFNASQRPRYVQCKETVAELMAKRDSAEGAQKSVGRTETLLREVTDKGINIFSFE
jgi:hypothetical protein